MLTITDLSVAFPASCVQALSEVSFFVAPGETVGIVGESGSGKSMTALAIAGLLPPVAKASGEIRFWGRRFVIGVSSDSDWRAIRGVELGVVFQDPSIGLNPLLSVGSQVSEVLRFHLRKSKLEAEKETVRLFNLLGLYPAKVRMRQFPHQLSGGMKQRVMLAAAICCRPRLLIADEPTTALDVSVQAQILCLLKELTAAADTALLLISHDLGVIAQLAERVLVLCAGQLVEEAAVAELFSRPAHPYTRFLLASVPRLDLPLALKVPAIEDNDQLLSGCGFASRCPERVSKCLSNPPLIRLSHGRKVRCHNRR
ncbi:MAG: ABC transporter ATP-binding protein [Dethiobacter sp.]|nr:ABC transporter ATP-binding protein [Dethiobacter sp.]MBS3897907.1 ABC transporter ATP-binding protein [Dethiobacter sp.]MBS3982171.1 ABC transporter ATP-binding protein [Dethiobacter sp.]MCL4463034.1 ABC transporter ATP-binding protein [Bacillota bacterium]MCL5993404.1 ABC transporter ATP-binding protein [Bacillota bacterium]